MKPVLILYPPFEGKNYLVKRSPFPIGPLYIAAYLEKHGIESRVLDLSYPPKKRKTNRPTQLKTGQSNYFRFGWTDLQIRKWLRMNHRTYNKIIGVSSLMSSNWTGAYRLIELIKHFIPRSIVVLGGPHATAFPEHVAKYSQADYVCIGEGEEPFLQFLKGERHEAIIKPTEGSKSRASFIEDMDSLPFPNRALLLDNRETRELYVTFSRGCPHKCSFCGSFLIQGRVWRNKSVHRVQKEIEHYYKQWKVHKFVIEDDNPCPGKKGIEHLKAICKFIIDKMPKIRLYVSHGIPVYATADKELCELMWKAGFRQMTFPIESTNPEVLKDMKKENTPKYWNIGIKHWPEKNPPAQIILGYPFKETIHSMLQTMFDIAKVKGRIWASHFRLNKGTPLFERCLEAGYITDDYDPINTQAFFLETERFNINDLKELMQISRGINFATERGFDPITEIPECKDFYDFKVPDSIGDIVTKGQFKFRRGQNICASILLARQTKKPGRPFTTFNEESNAIIYKGQKQSRVYDALIEILTGKKQKTIGDYL
ncbi:hypothetical protein AYK24_06590 [Thermoplasmatales archaeon SG8-52-4]|nr:MAG: hypothetical protein AYK24_06590 [Thermoplasmatales archaeon SG8-52-4]